ncbi:hypothetical protein [Pseudodesulfovibrio sp. zrk46]|uniref:hypothetical protein n=1 Tax=Pseudodesulfovibrio sp. zrk46 TaxID=2725288 RepID=UPI001448B927|nr:hypothetical protein [Pseudodesulfovibrio sp. zrk46]QJB57719.1 hypothetical protein HFN16_15465 [Pseudodesulfovibrio sp. zrk46]
MRPITIIIPLILLFFFSGCALGKKEWPSAVESEDTFTLKLMATAVQNNCIFMKVVVDGASHRLYRATIQYEYVGDGGGCVGCPFVPRDVVHFTRNQTEFDMSGNTLSLSLCGIDQDKEYRFRVAGKSELPASPIEYTDVYVTTP